MKLARCVVKSNDLVVFEDLKMRNMVKNHCLAKSTSDSGWRLFFQWLEYYGQVFGKIVIAVPPQYTSQECSACHRIVKKHCPKEPTPAPVDWVWIGTKMLVATF